MALEVVKVIKVQSIEGAGLQALLQLNREVDDLEARLIRELQPRRNTGVDAVADMLIVGGLDSLEIEVTLEWLLSKTVLASVERSASDERDRLARAATRLEEILARHRR